MTNKPFDRLVADSDLYATFYNMFLVWDTLNARNSKAGSFLDFSLIDNIESLIEQVPVQQVNKKPTAGRINRFIKDVTSLIAEHTDTPFHCKASCHTVYAKSDSKYDKIYHAVVSFYRETGDFSFHYRVNSIGDIGYAFKEADGKKFLTALYVETQADKVLMEFNEKISTLEKLTAYENFLRKMNTSREFEYSRAHRNFTIVLEAMKSKTASQNPCNRVRPTKKAA